MEPCANRHTSLAASVGVGRSLGSVHNWSLVICVCSITLPWPRCGEPPHNPLQSLRSQLNPFPTGNGIHRLPCPEL